MTHESSDKFDGSVVGLKAPVHTENSPSPVGPYSQGVRGGGMVFVSGQDPIDPATGAEPHGFAAQVHTALHNVECILTAAGSDRGDIVKITVYLSDPARFDDLNRSYADFFAGTVLPARTTVCVPHLQHALEVDCVAVSPIR